MVKSLGRFDEHAKLIVPALLGRTDDQSIEVRRALILALGRLGKGFPEAFEALKKFEDSNDAMTKTDLVIARALMDVSDPSTVPRLMEVMSSKDKETSDAATDALEAIAKKSPADVLPGLKTIVEKRDETGVSNALYVMRRMKDNAFDAVDMVAALYPDGDLQRRWDAVRTVVVIDKDGNKAIPLCVKALKDPEAKIRAAGLNGLMRFRKESEAALEHIFEAAGDTDASNQLAVLSLIKGIGYKHPAAVAPVVRLTQDGSASVRAAAIGTLSSLRPVTPEIIEALGKSLTDDDKRARKAALEAMRRAGIHDPDRAIAALERASAAEQDASFKKAINVAISALHEAKSRPGGAAADDQEKNQQRKDGR